MTYREQRAARLLKAALEIGVLPSTTDLHEKLAALEIDETLASARGVESEISHIVRGVVSVDLGLRKQFVQLLHDCGSKSKQVASEVRGGPLPWLHQTKPEGALLDAATAEAFLAAFASLEEELAAERADSERLAKELHELRESLNDAEKNKVEEAMKEATARADAKVFKSSGPWFGNWRCGDCGETFRRHGKRWNYCANCRKRYGAELHGWVESEEKAS